MSPFSPVPLLRSVAPLASSYDAWLCDVWGVIHNGVRAFPAATDACCQFRANGGIVVLLSNAPRPAAAVQAQLDRLEVPRDAYDAIVTSGDFTRSLLEQELSKPVLHLGPERDKGLFAGLDVTFAAESEAEVVVCSGLFDDERETPADYTARFAPLVHRGVPMICANPDLTVERGDRIIYCGGALGAEYERLGGGVTYAGKPHPPVYEMAYARIAEIKGARVPPARILAIGDGLRTDIRGAANAGLTSLFVASAIHVSPPLNREQIEALFGDSDARPAAAMEALTW
jgi:HAD superfamily hydrolase (TIGR01459 family)